MTTTQSLNELNNHFNEQLGFLKSSADAYDQGNTSEAKRLALTLRLLLHDTTNSKSLLGQLGLKNRIFYDSSSFERYNRTPWDIGVYTGLIGQCINIETEQISYIPILDRSADNKGTRWVGFEEWWNMVVIKDEVGHIFSRRDLVLTMANKDGGAHIDPILTGKYAAISRQNSLGWKGSIKGSAFQPILYPERAAVRQIAHEFLKSLDPTYTRNVPLGNTHFVAYNIVITLEPLKKEFELSESCPCGSGAEYQYYPMCNFQTVTKSSRSSGARPRSRLMKTHSVCASTLRIRRF